MVDAPTTRSTSKPVALVLVYITEAHRELVARTFDLLYAPNAGLGADRSNGAAQIAAHGNEIQVVLTNGTNGITTSEIDAMPGLKIVCTLGVGHENVPLDYARQHGVAVCNAANTNDDCVADHAMAILLAAVRGVPKLNRLCREGVWRDEIARPPHVSGRRMGILGLGAIGRKIARRALGFDLEIGYFSRAQRHDVPYRYFGDVVALARWSDYLMVSVPGGTATHHMVNAQVLEALGPQGVLVNVARGGVVDTAALADALREGRVYNAALDVYEGEPTPPQQLFEFDNVVLTPHVGGISPQAIHASVVRFIENATLHLAGKPLLSRVN